MFGFILTGIFTATISFTFSLWVLIFTQTISGIGRGLSFPVLMGLIIKYMPSEKRAVLAQVIIKNSIEDKKTVSPYF